MSEMFADLKKYSVVNQKYKEKDPRTLLYHFPSLPVITYAKMMQTYSFHQAVDAAERVSHHHGYLLVPSICIHWGRVKKFVNRRVKIGRNNFYFLRPKEMTKVEKEKLKNYIEDLEDET